MSKAILLTGTIDTTVFNNTNVKVTDLQVRLRQYCEAIEFYIAKTSFDKIVFAENSGYAFDCEKYKKIAERYGKHFELVRVITDYEKTISLGKSYGEADCIEQGVIKSQLLSDEKSFYKVTGRVIVRNIHKIIDKSDCSRCIFRNDLKRCYTVFFKLNMEDFKKYFTDCKERCNESKDIDIETVFYQIIIENDLQIKTFRYYPQYDGIIGTIGIAYNDPKFTLLIKNICLRLGMFSKNGNGRLLDTIAKVRVRQATRNGER